MAGRRKIAGIGKTGAVLASVAALALALPDTGLALPGVGRLADATVAAGDSLGRFTPASVDPELAMRVAEHLRSLGGAARFTPVGTATAGRKTVTVAVRVDGQTARAISVRQAATSVGKGTQATLPVSAPLAGTRYDLGMARGYQNFAKPAAPAVEPGLGNIRMPDLSEFKPTESQAGEKPSRFQPRIALEREATPGRSPRTLQGTDSQSVDLGGAYRLTRNLDVRAGVRLSQDRNRLDPLTDAELDNKAVYVGTQLKF